MSDSTELQHNVAARRDHIVKQFDDIFNLNEDIDTLRDKHVKPLTDARTKAWRNLKKDVDIPRKILELQFKQYALARFARENDDDGGDSCLDDMREVFNALHEGGQLDWVDAVDVAANDDSEDEPDAPAEPVAAE